MVTVFLMLIGVLWEAPAQSGLMPLRPGTQLEEIQANRLGVFVDDALVVDLDEGVVNQIVNEKAPMITMNLPLAEGVWRTFDLVRYEILTPDARTVSGTNAGDVEVDVRSSFVSYVANEPGVDFVSMSFFDRSLLGLVSVDDEIYVFGSLKDIEGFSNTDYVVYARSKRRFSETRICGNDVLDLPEKFEESIQALPPGYIESSDLFETTMALESDYETYLDFVTVENATAYLLSIMTAVSAVYVRDVNVRMTVGYSRVWSTPDDPYSSTSNGISVLNQFTSYWATNMQGVSRTLAHFFSTRPFDLLGVAWLNGLCSNGFGYGLSAVFKDLVDFPNYSDDVITPAHEIGHNFGSNHTHWCGWETAPGVFGTIDACWESEGSCVSSGSPNTGTVMSYCPNIILEFHILPLAVVRAGAEAAACMPSVSTDLVIVSPVGGEIFDNGLDIPISWSGTDTAGTIDIEYSSDNGTSWSPVAANVSFDDRLHIWTTPTVTTSTDENLIRIFKTSTPSVADTTEQPFVVLGEVMSGFGLLSPTPGETIMLDDVTDVEFLWESSGQDPLLIYNLRIYRGGGDEVFFLSENNGSDTSVVLSVPTIDSVMTAWGAWSNDKATVRWRPIAYLGYKVGNSDGFNNITFDRTITSIADGPSGIPTEYRLEQSYPNPFNPSTTIVYALPASGRVKLEVFNTLGVRIRRLVNNTQGPGVKNVVWNGMDDLGRPVSSGVYFYRIQATGDDGRSFSKTRKVLFVK